MAAGICAAIPAHASPLFDDFSLSQAGVVNTSAVGFADSGTVALNANTSRTLYTYNNSNDEPGFSDSKAVVFNNAFLYSSDDDVSGLGYIGYSFATPEDFTGNTDFAINLLTNDVVGILDIVGLDGHGNRSDTFATLPATTSLTTVNVNNVFVGDDITDIVTVYVIMGGARGEDLSLGSVVAAPEPASMVALGAAGLCLLRRRRSRA